MSTIGVIKQTSSKATDLPRVLVVEDDADTLVFLGKLLSTIPADGIPTATCAAARYALKTLGKGNIVIADRHLPDGDGVEMLQQFNLEHGCATRRHERRPPAR